MKTEERRNEEAGQRPTSLEIGSELASVFAAACVLGFGVYTYHLTTFNLGDNDFAGLVWILIWCAACLGTLLVCGVAVVLAMAAGRDRKEGSRRRWPFFLGTGALIAALLIAAPCVVTFLC